MVMCTNMRTKNTLLRMGMIGALLALAGSAMAQSAPAAPAAPAQPLPANPPAAALAPQDNAVGVMYMSSWAITRSENGRTITLEGKDGNITAQVDGKAVPVERVERDGNTVRIKDESGAVIFDQVVIEPTIATGVGGAAGGPVIIREVNPSRARSLGGMLGGSQPRAWAIAPRGAAGGNALIGEPVEQPKVMIGVQLAEPDASLRGHFGLKDGESTLISGVYEGLPAHAAGLEPYDIIVAVEGQATASPDSVRGALRSRDPGQSVRLDVLHKGERKSIALTLAAYDQAKMESAKVNAIAAAGNADDIFQTLSVTPGAPGQAWSFSRQGGPMVGAVPGADGKSRNQIFWKIDGNAAQHEELARQAQELAEKVAAQADAMAKQYGQTGNAAELNKRMEERMRKMEEMIRQMMERQNPGSPVPEKKDDKQSRRTFSRATMS